MLSSSANAIRVEWSAGGFPRRGNRFSGIPHFVRTEGASSFYVRFVSTSALGAIYNLPISPAQRSVFTEKALRNSKQGDRLKSPRETETMRVQRAAEFPIRPSPYRQPSGAPTSEIRIRNEIECGPVVSAVWRTSSASLLQYLIAIKTRKLGSISTSRFFVAWKHPTLLEQWSESKQNAKVVIAKQAARRFYLLTFIFILVMSRLIETSECVEAKRQTQLDNAWRTDLLCRRLLCTSLTFFVPFCTFSCCYCWCLRRVPCMAFYFIFSWSCVYLHSPDDKLKWKNVSMSFRAVLMEKCNVTVQLLENINRMRSTIVTEISSVTIFSFCVDTNFKSCERLIDKK